MENLLSAPNYTLLYILLGVAICIIFLLIFIIWRSRNTNEHIINSRKDRAELEDIKRRIANLKRTLTLALDAGDLSVWVYRRKDEMLVNIYGKLLSPEGQFHISKYMEYLHPDDVQLVVDAIDAMYKGEKQRVSLQYRIKAGTEDYKWIAVFCMPEYDEDGSVKNITGVTQDLTEQMSIQYQLKESEKQILNIVENLPIPVYIVDSKGNINFRNRSTAELFHTNSYDLTNQLSAEAYNYNYNANKRIIETGVPHIAHELFELKSGEVLQTYVSKILIDYNGEQQVLVARFDISEKVEFEQITKMLDLSLSAVNAFTWETDSRTDIINFSEGIDAVQNIHTLQEYLLHVHPDDLERIEELRRKATAKERSLVVVQYRANFTSEDGEYEWWETRSNYEVREDNGVEYELIYGVTININEHHALVSDLHTAVKKAQEADRLKSAFLANMSHEIRTPLNAIVGFSNLLISEDDNETKNEYSKIISHNGESLTNLINDILDFSKIEAGVFELKEREIDFVPLFNETVTSHTVGAYNSDVEIIAHNPYRELVVVLDAQRVLQIMNNYISNAIKYTAKGSVTIGYEVNDENLYFFVRDTGIGVGKEKQARLFKRFEKLDNHAQGTGLGLAIVEAITSKMGGNCGFESEEGKGSLFFVNIPIKVLSVNKLDTL